MTLENEVTKKIIRKLFSSEDYRIEVINLLDAMFLKFAVQFFEKIVKVKLEFGELSSNWYKEQFLKRSMSKDEIAINSGMNVKTIQNMFNSTRKEVVIDASISHYEELCNHIDTLIKEGGDLNIELTIKFRGVSVDLNLNETLMVINTLAVKRAEIRGGLWSTAGKQVEKPLMKALCLMFDVPEKYWNIKVQPITLREIDFYLLGGDLKSKYRCEVKLMGKGNPESADAIIARGTQVFIADKLGPGNKQQMNELGVHWVELRASNGFMKFEQVLEHLSIPHKSLDTSVDINERLDNILAKIL